MIERYELKDCINGWFLYEGIDYGKYTVEIKGMVIHETEATRATHHFKNYENAKNFYERKTKSYSR